MQAHDHRHHREGAVACFVRAGVGYHAYRQVAAGVGGGEAIKQSVSRPVVRAYLENIGAHLRWHGALSVDTIMPVHGTAPLLIDCNPRLVEPMNAYRAGVDLVGLLLLDLARRDAGRIAGSRPGVRRIWRCRRCWGCASRGGTRSEIVRECVRLLGGGGEPMRAAARN